MSLLKKRPGLMLLLGLYLLYAAAFIYRSSFTAGGQRYFVLLDDAMISMRYARNLASGYGLVWNPGGERVEGITNPLWTAYMAAWHLLPLPPRWMSLPVQASGALLLAGTLVLVYLLAEHFTSRRWAGWAAVLLTGWYAPLNTWALMGMEVGALAFLLTLSVYLYVKAASEERFSPWPYAWLALGTLIRMDMAVPLVATSLFWAWQDAPHRRRHLAWGLGLLTLSLGGQTLARLAYYGAPLPNTYYLKVSGFPLRLRLERGLFVLAAFVQDFNWLLFLFPLLALALRKERVVRLSALLFAAQVAYSVYVGGDAWENKGGANRYLAIALPLFFFLFALGLERLYAALAALAAERGRRRMLQAGMALFLLGAVFNMNYLLQNPTALARWALLRPPLFAAGNRGYLHMALVLDETTDPEAQVAVVTAGVIPYFAERPCIDMLGKSDVYIAHLPYRGGVPLSKIRPGHMKYDYAYSIGKLQPDVVTMLWRDQEEGKPFLAPYALVEAEGTRFWARWKSPHIRWERVKIIRMPGE